MKIISVILCLFCCAASASAYTEESTAMASLLHKGLAELVDLEVSLATGTPKLLKTAPSVATVITAQDIEDMGAATLDEVLQTVPGLYVLPSSQNIFSNSWVFRGVSTAMNPQVLLLIDGQPLRINSNGSKPYVLRMPVSMISRVEIIRGPGSAILGADAFAGAINIITKDSDEIAGSGIGARGGSFGARDVWARHGGSYNGWDLAIGAEYARGDGDSSRTINQDALGSGPPSLAPGPLDTHYETFNSSLNVRKDKFTFRLNNVWMIDNGLGASLSNTLNGGMSHTREFFLGASLGYIEKDLFKDFDLTATASGAYLRFENTLYFYPESYKKQIGKPGVHELTGGVEFVGDYHGFSGHRARLMFGMNNYNSDPFQHKNFGGGVPVQFGDVVDITETQYVYMTDHHRRLLYAGVQDEWTFAENWELTAGIRYDDYSDFGSVASPRLALVWRTTPELVSKLLYGRAFRPPSFGEMFMQNNLSIRGNPELDAETIDTYEVAFDYRPLRTVRLGLNLFEYGIDGLIDYVADPAPATTRTAQNARDQKGRGFEVEAEWMATEALRLRANYSYQRAKDSLTDAVIPYVPASKFYANANWKFMPRWSLDGQYYRVTDRHRAVGDTRPDIEDYSLANLTLRRKNIANRFDMALAVRNVFNNNVREPSQPVIPGDFPMERRGYWAELSYTF